MKKERKLLITIIGVLIILIISLSLTIVVATQSNSSMGQLELELLNSNEDYAICTGTSTFNPSNPDELSEDMKDFIGVPITIYELGTTDSISIQVEDYFSYVGDATILVVARDDKDKMLDFITYKFEKVDKRLAIVLDISNLTNISSIHHFEVYAWDNESNLMPITINSEVINDL